MASTREAGGSVPGDGAGLALPATSPSHSGREGQGSAGLGNLASSFIGRSRRRHKNPPGSSNREGHNNADKTREEGTETQGPASGPRSHGGPWWRIWLFRGMVNDIRRRAPYYVSDYTDAWNYRVVPATVYMYFAKCVFLFPLPLLGLCTYPNPPSIS